MLTTPRCRPDWQRSSPTWRRRRAEGRTYHTGVAVRKIHDLVELQSTLIPADAAVVSSEDIDVLVPWNIAGRYPADVGDADSETAATTVEAASRIVDGLTRRIYGTD